LTYSYNVYTIVLTMKNNDTATVIKSGNSIALRVPKSYADKNSLIPGLKVRLSSPIAITKKTSHKKLQEQLKEIQKLSIYKGIKDPVAWQRKQRERSKQADRNY